MVHSRSHKENEWVETLKSSENWDARHEKFQFNSNPMKMTSFEESCCKKEVQERTMARERYIQGIQGRDGGCIYPKKSYFKGHDDYESDPLY